MKKLYILIAVLYTSILPIHAQLNLTLASHGYVPGDVYTYFYGDTTNFNPGLGGQNVSWAFNGWNIVPMLNTINYIDPASTPYASSFPNASFAWEKEGSYVYYKSGSSGFFTEGIADSNNTLVYSDDEQMRPFPFTFNTNSSDYFSGSVTNAGIRIARNGQINSIGDGWGKLDINGKTFYNVLRVKMIQDMSDYQINVSTGDTAAETHYKTTTYHWYRSSSKNPIINYSETKFYKNKSTIPYMTNKEIFVDNTATSINDNRAEQINFTIYPNPTNGLVNLETKLPGSAKLNIEVTNMNGQLVYSEIVDNKAIVLSHTFDVSNLSQGIYTVKIFNNEAFGIRKLILQ